MWPKHLGISEILKNILINYPEVKTKGSLRKSNYYTPSLILADEPTGALDSKSARMLLESFETLNHDLSATILMVTHDAFYSQLLSPHFIY